MANAARQRRDDDSDLPMGSLAPFPQQTQQAQAPVANDDSDLPMGSLAPFPQAPAPVQPSPPETGGYWRDFARPAPRSSLADLMSSPGAFAGLPGVPEQTEGWGALPEPPPDTRVGAMQSAVDAARDVRNESWQLAQGDAFDPNQPIPPPVERTFGGRLTYGLTKTSPTMAGMVLGAAGGVELGTPMGPWGAAIGGAAGGALGGGVAAFTQELIPAYQDARRRDLTHEQAVDEAYRVAATGGLITGATAPLFSLRYVKNIVGDILLKTAVTGPAVGAAQQVATPMVTGQPMPTGEEMLEGYVQNAVGGLALAGAGHTLPRIIDRFRPDTRPNLNMGTTPMEPGQGALPGPRAPPPAPPGAGGPAPPSVDLPWRRSTYDPNAGPPAVEGPFGQLFTPGQEPPPVQTPPASVPAPWRRGAIPTGSEPVETSPTGTEAALAPGAPVPVEPATPAAVPLSAIPPEHLRVLDMIADGEKPTTFEDISILGLFRRVGVVTVDEQGGLSLSPMGQQMRTRAYAARSTDPNQSPLTPLPTASPAVVPPSEPIPTTGQEPDGQISTTATPVVIKPDTSEPVPGAGTTGTVSVAPGTEPVETPTPEPAVIPTAGGGLPVPGVEPLTPTPTTPAGPEGAKTPVPAEPAAAPAEPEPPAKRPVTETEYNQLRTDLSNARKALDTALRKGEPQAKIEKLQARVAETGEAYDNAVGPPTRPTFMLGGKSRPELMAGHEADVKAHEAAVTRRIHAEGETPVADPKGVARVFTKDIVTASGSATVGGKQTFTAVLAKDTKGGEWAGTGNIMTRDPVMVKAAKDAAANRSTTVSLRQDVEPDALERVVAQKKDLTYEPVTWERTVAPGGGRLVIGTLKSGEHVTLQKPIFDALSSAAGKGGILVSAGIKKDDRVFALDAKGEVVGVGTPYKLDQPLARSYARGTDGETKAPTPEPPAEPAATPVAKPASKARNVYRAEANGNRSQTWRIIEIATGKVVQDHIVNRVTAQQEAQRLNAEAKTKAAPPAPVEPKTPEPAVEPAAEPKAEPKAKALAKGPETTTVRAEELKAGDVIRTPGGKDLTVTEVKRDATGAVIVKVEGRAKALPYGPKMDVKIHTKGAVSDEGDLGGEKQVPSSDPDQQKYIDKVLETSAEQVSPKDLVLGNLDLGDQLGAVIAPDGRLYVFKQGGDSRYDIEATHNTFRDDFPGHRYAEVTVWNGNNVAVSATQPFTPGQLRTANILRHHAIREGGKAEIYHYDENNKAVTVGDEGSVESKTFGPTPSASKAAARRAAGLQPHRPAPRVRRQKLQPVPRVPVIGAPLTLEDFSHTRAVTHYRDAFHDALAGTGEDAANAANRPITEQIALLTGALKTKYGFKDVIVEPNVEPRLTRDQLLNMHHNMQNMAAALGWSEQVISLLGRLQLHLVPRGFNGEHWMGQYSFANNEIGISGGSNSYAHEHWHAIDHYLSDLLNKNPNKTALFSQAGKEGQIDTSADPVQKAFAELLNLLSHDQGALMLRRMMLSNTAALTDKAGNPTPKAIIAQAQLAMIDRAQTTKLKIPPSPFKAQALGMVKGASYYAQIYELMARAGEAYTGYVMTQQRMDTAGVVKADAAYRSQTIAYLKQAYPNPTDRALIFAGFDKLVVEMQRSGILTAAHVPALRASEGTTLPMWHDQPPDIGPGFLARLKADIRALRPSELWGADHDWFFTPEEGSPPPLMYDSRKGVMIPKGSFSRGVDQVSRIFGAAMGNLERLRRQAPPAAKGYVTEVMDRIGVSHEGRLQPVTFEELVRIYTRPTISEFEDILRTTGLTNKAGRLRLSPLENKHFWHALTTGEKTYPANPDGTGTRTAISDKIMAATARTRVLMDRAHEYMKTEGGLDVGYPRDVGYAPRVFDDNRILANETGFVDDMTGLNKVIIDKDLAREPNADAQVARLAEWWSDSETALRGSNSLDPATRDAMNRIVVIQGRVKAIDAELAAGGAGKSPVPNLHDPAKLRAERDTLLQEGRDLYRDHKDAARDHIAKYEAQSRFEAIASVDPVKFETFGPRSEFLKKRTLPGEADQYLRDWLIQDPRVGLSNYFNGVGRKVAYTKMFGEKGDILEGLTQRMILAKMAKADVDQVSRIIELVTGRAMRDKNVAATVVANTVSALGSFMMLSGASISAFGETFGTMMLPAGTAGQRFRFMASTLAKTFGQFMHTADAAERAALVRYIGGVTSHLQGMASAGRFADYAGTPTLGKWVNAFLEMGLGRTIRAMRAALAGSGTDFLRVLLNHAMGPENTTRQKNMKDDAQRMLREWGVPNGRMLELKQWSDGIGDRLPFRSELDTPTGKLFAQALRRLMDRLNVDPGPADKAMGSLQTPMFNTMFALTSFIYTTFRHHIMPSFHHVGHAYARQAERARALPGGASNAKARYQGSTAFARQLGAAVLGAGALVGGTFLVSMIRNYIFSPDTWAKHEEDGTLLEWLAGSAMSQSGIGGPPDLILQALNGLRYHADLSNLTQGAFLAADTRHLIDIGKWAGSYLSGKETSTNTEAYNALYAGTQLIYKPGMLASLAWLSERTPARGPLATILLALSVLGASSATTRGMVNAVAGERGSTRAKEGDEDDALTESLSDKGLDDDMDAKNTKEGGGGSAAASAAVGFADDALVPLLRFAPSSAKTIGAGVGLVAMFAALIYDASQYDTPPKKKH